MYPLTGLLTNTGVGVGLVFRGFWLRFGDNPLLSPPQLPRIIPIVIIINIREK